MSSFDGERPGTLGDKAQRGLGSLDGIVEPGGITPQPYIQVATRAALGVGGWEPSDAGAVTTMLCNVLVAAALALIRFVAAAGVPDHRARPLPAARRTPAPADTDRDLRAFGKEHPVGHTAVLKPSWSEEGQQVQRNKIQRLWRDEGLCVASTWRKRLRLGDSTTRFLTRA